MSAQRAGHIVDEEGGITRKLHGAAAFFVTIIAVAASLYHIYLGRFGILEALQMRSLHLAWMLPLAFILYPATRRSPRTRPTSFDLMLALLSISATTYVGLWEYDRIVERWVGVDPLTFLDIAFGIGLIVMVLEAGRRTMGWPLSIVLLVALAYLILGQYLPWSISHSGFSLQRIMEQMYLTPEGIFGIPVGASATFVILYVIFAAFLERSGVGQFFMDLGSALVGSARGGPAKVAVFVSAFEGMITGSAVANTVGSGAVTIPMMKRLGYKPHFAAAVEAAASTGGQIMPPVMGVAAFVMAEFLGMSYSKVALAAVIPAILYFLAVGLMVHFEALKRDLRGLPKEQLPRLGKVLSQGWHLPLPIVLIVLFLMAGFSAYLAAFWAILSSIAISWIRKETRMGPRAIAEALAAGAKGTVLIAVATATAGMIVGTITLTGIGLKFVGFVVGAAHGNLFLALILAAVACLILGTGMPTVPAYVTVAAVAVPALVDLGVTPIAAHMFAIYFSSIAAITPPDASAAYAGAGIAGADPWRTGFTATRLGAAAYIVPFMFCFGPSLLLIGSVQEIIWGFLTALVGTIVLAAAVQGWLLVRTNLWERAFLGAGSLLLLTQGIYSDLAGFGLLAAVILSQKYLRPKPQDSLSEITTFPDQRR